MWFSKDKPKAERILVNDELFSQVAEMRYKIYCEELGFLERVKYPNKKETDEYDGTSIHVVVHVGKRLGGYARVVLPSDKGLPIFAHFEIPEEGDTDHSCEISRFMISQYYRKRVETRREIFRLIAEEILKIVKENDIRHVYAVIEDWLLKSLIKRGYNFEKIGEGHFHMGAVTFPVKLEINK